MARLKGKYKGKSGKIIVMEDLIGTEELSGTYKGREQNWKNIRQEKMLIADWQRKRLKEALKKKEDQLKENKVRSMMGDQVKVANLNQKIDFLLPYLLDNDAYRHIFMIKQTEPQICQQMMHYLFQPRDLQNIDRYIDVITQKGHGPKRKISLVTVMKIERKVKGVKQKIEVERDGKRRRIG